MNEVPLTSKNIFTFLLLLAITLGFTLLLVYFNQTIKDEPVEETIEFKYSKKGLYLFPRFEIHVSNSERPSIVSKEQYESIAIGDKISGYKKNADTFVTEKDIQFEKGLGMVILFFLYFITLAYLGLLLKNTKFFAKSKKFKNILHQLIKINMYGFLTIYIVVGMLFTVLTATNVFHKLNKWNQTVGEATVLGGDFHQTRSQRGASYTTYELFLLYQDKEGTNYITKKAVTGNTYNTYNSKEAVPLIYRNNNEYDTFIQTKHVNEVWPAFMNLYIFFITFYLISFFFLIKAWRKKKHKQSQQKETWSSG